MNTPLHQAWRFVHPDWDPGSGWVGLQLTPAGRIELVAGAASVRQAILLLISTIPGERVMRPDYGCHLHKLIFAPNDGSAAGLAIHYVRQALTRWEPRIDLLDVDAQRHPVQDNVLDIYLLYRVRASGQTDDLLLSLPLAGPSSGASLGPDDGGAFAPSPLIGAAT